jgi:hypothetical protein
VIRWGGLGRDHFHGKGVPSRRSPIIIPLPPAQEKIEPERLAKFPPASTLREAVLLLARLARDPAFLDARVYPLLEGARRAEDWYLARSYEARDGSCSLQVFGWP